MEAQMKITALAIPLLLVNIGYADASTPSPADNGQPAKFHYKPGNEPREILQLVGAWFTSQLNHCGAPEWMYQPLICHAGCTGIVSPNSSYAYTAFLGRGWKLIFYHDTYPVEEKWSEFKLTGDAWDLVCFWKW
jgi:hypothetical protein